MQKNVFHFSFFIAWSTSAKHLGILEPLSYLIEEFHAVKKRWQVVFEAFRSWNSPLGSLLTFSLELFRCIGKIDALTAMAMIPSETEIKLARPDETKHL